MWNFNLAASGRQPASDGDRSGIRSWSISRVLSWTAIPLGPELLQGSSHLPASSAGRLDARLFGVAPGGGCRVSPLPRLARRCRHTPCPAEPRLVSVALFLAFAARHRNRRSPYGRPTEPKAPSPPDGCGLVSTLPHATYSGRELPATVPCGARTFLCARSGAETPVCVPCTAAAWPASRHYFTAHRAQGSHSPTRGLE